MYKTTENILPDNVLQIELDTDEPTAAKDTLDWSLAVINALRTINVGDGEPDIVIRHIGEGSTLIDVILAAAGLTVATATFAVTLGSYMRDTNTEVSRATFRFGNDYGASEVTISCSSQEPIVIRIGNQATGAMPKAALSSDQISDGVVIYDHELPNLARDEVLYRENMPSLNSDRYPEAKALNPALPYQLRVADAADAHFFESVGSVGRFAQDANGILYFGTQEIYGPVMYNPNIKISDYSRDYFVKSNLVSEASTDLIYFELLHVRMLPNS